MKPLVKNIYNPELLSPILKLHKVFPNQIYHYDVNEETEWLGTFIQSLSKDEDSSSSPTFQAKFTLKRLNSNKLNHPVACEGFINYHINDECVRCLAPVSQTEEVGFKFVFIPKEFEENEEIEDQEHLYSEGQDWEIVIMEGQNIDFQDVFNELIQISVDPFPLHDENCKGLCQDCGTNLNLKACNCASKRK